MPSAAMAANPAPFVDTTVSRQIISRLLMAHHERKTVVISGPWGIGKTTAIRRFADSGANVVVIKCRPGGHKSGRTAPLLVKQIAESLSEHFRNEVRLENQHAIYALERIVIRLIKEWEPYWHWSIFQEGAPPLLTLIFDEAQYLSREALDYLRYWNDEDETVTPFPIGMAFVGNPEFALDDKNGESVISGALDSRIDEPYKLSYVSVTDDDLRLFAISRGIDDRAALTKLTNHFKSPSIPTDLRKISRAISRMHRRANGAPVTAEIVESILG